MKNALKKTIEKWFLNEQGEISMTKIGAEITGLAAMVLIVPTLDLSVIQIPQAIIDLAKIAAAIGGTTAVVGARNAGKK